MGGNSVSTRASKRETKDDFDPRSHMEEHAVQLCNIQHHHWVLALGFAEGHGLKRALERVKNGSGKVCGMDSSQTHIQYACDTFAYEIMSNKLEVNQGGPYNIPYMTNTFECVFLVNDFREWKDLDGALQEIHRVMRHGSLMITCCGQEITNTSKTWEEKSQKRNTVVDFWEALKENGFVRVRVEQHFHSGTGYKYKTIYAYTRKHI